MKTETAHTPGPYLVDKRYTRGDRLDDDFAFRDEYGNYDANLDMIIIDMPTGHGALNGGHNGAILVFGEGEILTANADLIAKAPLLPECEAVLQSLRDCLAEAHADDKAASHYGGKSCSYCEVIEDADALLAKLKETP